METLLIIGIIFLGIITIVFLVVMIALYRFIKDLQELVASIQDETDKLKLNMTEFYHRFSNKSSLLVLLLGLLGQRSTLKKAADLFVSYRRK